MIRRPPRSTRTDTLFPYTTLFRSLPFYWMVTLALKSNSELAVYPPTLWPHDPQWGNFKRSTEVFPFWEFGRNTVIITALTIVGAVISNRSEEHTSELQSLMRISYAVFCLKKNKNNTKSIAKQ